MINQAVLTGRLGKDPELRQTQTGMTVATFSLAVDRPKGKDGQRGTDWINCKAFGKRAEVLQRYTRKGSMIGVVGHIQTGSYDSQRTGQKVYTTDVIVDDLTFLDAKKPDAGSYAGTQAQTVSNPYKPQPAGAYGSQAPAGGQYGGVTEPEVDDMYGDLPF